MSLKNYEPRHKALKSLGHDKINTKEFFFGLYNVRSKKKEDQKINNFSSDTSKIQNSNFFVLRDKPDHFAATQRATSYSESELVNLNGVFRRNDILHKKYVKDFSILKKEDNTPVSNNPLQIIKTDISLDNEAILRKNGTPKNQAQNNTSNIKQKVNNTNDTFNLHNIYKFKSDDNKTNSSQNLGYTSNRFASMITHQKEDSPKNTHSMLKKYDKNHQNSLSSFNVLNQKLNQTTKSFTNTLDKTKAQERFKAAFNTEASIIDESKVITKDYHIKANFRIKESEQISSNALQRKISSPMKKSNPVQQKICQSGSRIEKFNLISQKNNKKLNNFDYLKDPVNSSEIDCPKIFGDQSLNSTNKVAKKVSVVENTKADSRTKTISGVKLRSSRQKTETFYDPQQLKSQTFSKSKAELAEEQNQARKMMEETGDFQKRDVVHFFKYKADKKKNRQSYYIHDPNKERQLKRGNNLSEGKRVGFKLPDGHVIYVSEHLAEDFKKMGIEPLENKNYKIGSDKIKLEDSTEDKLSIALRKLKAKPDAKAIFLQGLVQTIHNSTTKEKKADQSENKDTKPMEHEGFNLIKAKLNNNKAIDSSNENSLKVPISKREASRRSSVYGPATANLNTDVLKNFGDILDRADEISEVNVKTDKNAAYNHEKHQFYIKPKLDEKDAFYPDFEDEPAFHIGPEFYEGTLDQIKKQKINPLKLKHHLSEKNNTINKFMNWDQCTYFDKKKLKETKYNNFSVLVRKNNECGDTTSLVNQDLKKKMNGFYHVNFFDDDGGDQNKIGNFRRKNTLHGNFKNRNFDFASLNNDHTGKNDTDRKNINEHKDFDLKYDICFQAVQTASDLHLSLKNLYALIKEKYPGSMKKNVESVLDTIVKYRIDNSDLTNEDRRETDEEKYLPQITIIETFFPSHDRSFKFEKFELKYLITKLSNIVKPKLNYDEKKQSEHKKDFHQIMTIGQEVIIDSIDPGYFKVYDDYLDEIATELVLNDFLVNKQLLSEYKSLIDRINLFNSSLINLYVGKNNAEIDYLLANIRKKQNEIYEEDEYTKVSIKQNKLVRLEKKNINYESTTEIIDNSRHDFDLIKKMQNVEGDYKLPFDSIGNEARTKNSLYRGCLIDLISKIEVKEDV